MPSIRFAFLSDAHVVEPVNPVLRRVFGWARDLARAEGAGDLILGGDMTHHASADQALAALDAVAYPGVRLHVLPGNNEGPGLAWDPLRYPPPVRGVRRLEWPGQAYAVAATDGASLGAALEELAGLLPDAGPVLVFAHLPPDETGEVPDAFRRPGLNVIWVCGHRHEAVVRQAGSIRVELCGGLDPVKVRGHLPELLLGDWDGTRLLLERRRVPREALRAPGACPPVLLGLACRGAAVSLLETAVREGAGALQFHHGDAEGRPSAADRAAVARFRAAFNPGVLSLHLPDLASGGAGVSVPEPVAAQLEWAAAMGVDDLTLHLPNAPVDRLFDGDGRFRESAWAGSCLAAYVRLAECALAMGAGLSLENMYNKGPVAPASELLSSRPWHLLWFVDRLRAELLALGHAAGAVSRVGLLLDVGHAFRDPLVSKTHGLGDWIQRLAPMLRMAHLHQVLEQGGKLTNHHAISNLCGPRINYAGLLPLFQEVVPRPIPLFIEVREVGEASASRRVLVSG